MPEYVIPLMRVSATVVFVVVSKTAPLPVTKPCLIFVAI